jgi:branched-chain amino acid transport system permease protein
VRLASRLPELLFPALLVGVTALLGSVTAQSNEIHFRTALVDVAIVVGLYVFIGNSGVLSFGQISFVAVGAFLAGELTISTAVKRGIMPDLLPILRDHSVGNVESLLLAAGLGAVFAFLVGLPLMR